MPKQAGIAIEFSKRYTPACRFRAANSSEVLAELPKASPNASMASRCPNSDQVDYFLFMQAEVLAFSLPLLVDGLTATLEANQ
jgi:hypothetical protein